MSDLRHQTQTTFTTWNRLFRMSSSPFDPALTEAVEDVLSSYGLQNTYILPNGDIVGPYTLAGEFDYQQDQIRESLGMIDYEDC